MGAAIPILWGMKRHLNDIIADPSDRQNLADRFWPKVEVREPNECWPWIAKAVNEHGYGRMSAGRMTYLKSHRVAYALQNGNIPDGMAVLHSCDNPICCNHHHLRLGTQIENMADRTIKRRGSKPPTHFGEKHHSTKFDAKTALAISKDQRSARLVATEHNISQMTVYRLRHGTTWVALKR